MTDRSTREPDLRDGRLRVPRSRGATSVIVLVPLGAWTILVPLVGPYVDFGYSPDSSWTVTSGRFWLHVLPGAMIVFGGLLLLLAADRLLAGLGAWLGVAGGAWLVVGPALRSLVGIGSAGLAVVSVRDVRVAQQRERGPQRDDPEPP